MLLRFLHRLAALPSVYDRIQIIAGANLVYEKLRRELAAYPDACRILDVGGGTGTLRALFPRTSQYICLDIEWPKLQKFRAKAPGGMALLSDAGLMPIAPQSVDMVVCMFVAHHMDTPTLTAVLDECRRVLRIDGLLVFLDPLHAPRRPLSRLLWALDRGAFPRSAESLRQLVEGLFCLRHWEEFSIYHRYILGIATAARDGRGCAVQ